MYLRDDLIFMLNVLYTQKVLSTIIMHVLFLTKHDQISLLDYTCNKQTKNAKDGHASVAYSTFITFYANEFFLLSRYLSGRNPKQNSKHCTKMHVIDS